MRINSPGGTITASDVLYHEILAFKQRKKVPVIAAIMDVGASGGYYAALAADTIVVNPTTITGSIGVVMVTLNAQGLMQKIGVAPLAIKSGPMKDAGSPFRGAHRPELAVFQGIIDDMYGRFVGLIVQSRKMPEDRVRALADGRVYTAEQALKLGLVDRIGYLEDVVTMAEGGRARPGEGDHVPPAEGVPREHLLGAPAPATAESHAGPVRGRARRGRAPLSLHLVALSFPALRAPWPRSSASRTLRPSPAGVNGFWMKAVPGSSTPCRTIASSV